MEIVDPTRLVAPPALTQEGREYRDRGACFVFFLAILIETTQEIENAVTPFISVT